jgi:uncharacterized protein YcaQ
MVTRDNFKKVYDIPLNVIPDDIDTTMPTPTEFARHVIKRSLKALGIGYAKEIVWRSRWVKTNLVKQELEKMVAEGELCAVTITGCKTAPLYMLPGYKNKKIELSNEAYILSPFDILNVFRHRLKDFFDFDYQIECFVPQAKRKYGYFSLPVLVGDQFVARMDCKADRKQKVLIVHNCHFEPVTLSKPMLGKISAALKTFATFNGCTDVHLKKTNSKPYGVLLKNGG